MEKYRPFGIKTLFKKSSVGATGAVTAGTLLGTFYAMGVVFVDGLGLSVSDVSMFMGIAILGGFFVQWPVGKLSDLFDRRFVMIGVATLPLIAWTLYNGLTINPDKPSVISRRHLPLS